MNNKEIWRDVENYKNYYQISNYGRVKSLDRIIIRSDNKKQFVKSRIMKSFLTKQYYWRVSLRKNGTIKKYNVHRLVAQAFIKNPKNKPEVNHKNGIKFDNFLKIWNGQLLQKILYMLLKLVYRRHVKGKHVI